MNKQFISKFAAFAAVAAVSGSILMTQSCKKNEDFATDIKVEDSEDTEKTKTDIGVAEIKDKYTYMTGVYQDSVNYELGKLQAEYKLVTDTLTLVLNANSTNKNNELTLKQNLDIALKNANQAYNEEELAMVIRLAEKEDDLRGKILGTTRDSASAAVTINGYEIQIAKANAAVADELAKAAQTLQTQITAEEVMTQAQVLNLQKAIQGILLDSITNVYSISKKLYDLDAEIIAKQQDSIAADYALMFKSVEELNYFITDTVTSNVNTEIALDAKQKELMLTLLKQTNNQSIAMYKEAERVKAELLTAQLAAEKALDIATKAYDDYVASKTTLVAEEKTELTVVLFSLDPQGNSVLLTGDATVLLDGEVVDLTNGMGVVLGDLEGDRFITVTATDHLKTTFSFTIEEVTTNDDAADFKLYKQRLEVKLLKANTSFTVSGKVTANTTDHEFYTLGSDYDYLRVADVFDVVTDADLQSIIQNEMKKRLIDEGANEKIAGMNVSVKVSTTDAVINPDTYVGGNVTNVSNFNMENTVAITATTAADGTYTLENVPVLNDDFKVEVVLENKRFDQSKILYGQDVDNKKVTKTVKYNTKTVQNITSTIDNAERANGIVLFRDFNLF